jgi:hypothetical protein
LYNVEESAQGDIMDDTPVFSKTTFGAADDDRRKRLKELMT